MFTILKRHWVAIMVTTFITFSVSVALTVTQPMEYRSAFTVLAIDNDANLDGYAAAKSAERLSQSLGRTIPTTVFADFVYGQLKARADLKDNPLISSDIQTRRDEWSKRITVQSIPDVGQVKVAVYQSDRTQAEIIANAISIAVTATGSEYLGGGKDVVLKIVDTPLTTKTPVRPNVFANLAVGIILGLGGAIAILLLFATPAQPTAPFLFAPMTPAMFSPLQTASQGDHLAHGASSQPAPVMNPTGHVQPQTTKQAVTQPEPELHIPLHPNQPSQPKTISSSPANLPVIDEIVMP